MRNSPKLGFLAASLLTGLGVVALRSGSEPTNSVTFHLGTPTFTNIFLPMWTCSRRGTNKFAFVSPDGVRYPLSHGVWWVAIPFETNWWMGTVIVSEPTRSIQWPEDFDRLDKVSPKWRHDDEWMRMSFADSGYHAQLKRIPLDWIDLPTNAPIFWKLADIPFRPLGPDFEDPTKKGAREVPTP